MCLGDTLVTLVWGVLISRSQTLPMMSVRWTLMAKRQRAGSLPENWRALSMAELLVGVVGPEDGPLKAGVVLAASGAHSCRSDGLSEVKRVSLSLTASRCPLVSISATRLLSMLKGKGLKL